MDLQLTGTRPSWLILDADRSIRSRTTKKEDYRIELFGLISSEVDPADFIACIVDAEVQEFKFQYWMYSRQTVNDHFFCFYIKKKAGGNWEILLEYFRSFPRNY